MPLGKCFLSRSPARSSWLAAFSALTLASTKPLMYCVRVKVSSTTATSRPVGADVQARQCLLRFSIIMLPRKHAVGSESLSVAINKKWRELLKQRGALSHIVEWLA